MSARIAVMPVEMRASYLEERCAVQMLVIAELTDAIGQLIKHCHPDKPPGLALDEARINAVNVMTRYTEFTRANVHQPQLYHD